jgi:anaerobic selenocysteine-containing dehydrogenase
MGMLHVVLRDGLEKRAFIEAHTTGFEQVAESAKAWDPERAGRITGVPPEAIEKAAHWIGEADRAITLHARGLEHQSKGVENCLAVINIALACGHIGREGAGCMMITGQGNGQGGREHGQRCNQLPSGRDIDNPEHRRLVAERWGVPEESIPGVGLASTEMREAIHAGEIRGLLSICFNPLVSLPDADYTRTALEKLEFFACIDFFLSETARHADVVLPATSSLEHVDLYRSYGHHTVQRVAAAVDPVGESKPNWEVFQLLAAAMGFEEPLFRKTADEVVDLVLERSRATGWWDGVDRARLDAGGAVTVRPPAARARWGTPSGKIELRNDRHAEPLPRFLPSYSRDGRAGRLPLQLVTAPALYTLNSTFQERPELRAKAGGMTLQLAPPEAAARGLGDGARVVAWNELGEAVFTLRVTDRVPPGVAVAEGVFWLAQAPGGRNVNALTSQRLTDGGNGSTFYDNRIDVRAAG